MRWLGGTWPGEGWSWPLPATARPRAAWSCSFKRCEGKSFFYFSALYLIESESDWDVGILEEVPLRQAAEDTWCLHGLLGWHIDGDNLSLSSPGRCRPPPSTVGTRSTPPMQHCLKTFDTPSTEYYIPSPISSIFSAWRIDATTQPRVIAQKLPCRNIRRAIFHFSDWSLR